MENLIQSIEEDFELAKKRAIIRIQSFFKDGNHVSSETNMKLKFRNKIPREILTGEEIKGEGGAPIEVALVDDPTGNIVDDGPEASATVQIVLLKGDADPFKEGGWTVEEFNANIVPEMEGKQPLLAGNVPLKLQRGIGVLENVKLRNHAINIRPSVFKLGARAVGIFDGVRIKHAETEPFTVKDFRYKYYKKHEIPTLSDEVSRLVNIRKGGMIDKRLQNSDINSVEDFLIRLLINPDELKTIMNLGPKKWEATVSNARACPTEGRMYCYVNLEQKIGVAFNVYGQVLGLYSESYYSPTSMLSEEHKAGAHELLASAYQNWENHVKPFDDVDPLLQYLSTCLTGTQMDPLDSVKTDSLEMVGESSSRRSNLSFHSAMNSFRECAGGEEFSSFGIDDVDVEGTMYDTVMHSPLNLEAMFPGFDEFLQQNEGRMIKTNSDEHSDVRFVESNDVQTSNPPNRWKKLLCVSRWFFVRKRVSLEITRNRKKHKIDG